MGRRSKFRVLLALALALNSLAAVALPAAAEIVLDACTGTCGYYQVKDQGPTGPKGAVCVYLNNTTHPDLARITVRPPLMHGNYPTKTKVGWRFRIQREPVSSMTFTTLYTSPWQTALADNAIPANVGSGFSRRAWSAPPDPHGRFRVWIEMRWWYNGAVDGSALVQYDWYKAMRGGSSYTDQSYCLEDY